MEDRAALLTRVSTGAGTEIKDPATGEVIGLVSFGTPGDVAGAVAVAAAAQPGWAALSDGERCAALMRAADAIDAHAEELAYVVSREQGKTMNGLGARFEAAGCAAWVRAAASTPRPDEVLLDDETGRAMLHYRPIGVVGAITPWNWPMIIASWQIAPALRMGNTVVNKPSEYTTLSGLAIVAVLSEALPPGVLTTVTGAGDVGDALGPLQNQMQWNVVNRLVEDAKARGARVVMGGDPDPGAPGYFYPKTLIADIDNSAPLVQEEQFGPALPIIRYARVEQAVEWANGVDVGLGASVWSADREAALAIAARMQAGTVWINSHGGIDPRVPFGGAKHSGYGLEFGVEGLKAVSVPQVISG